MNFSQDTVEQPDKSYPRVATMMTKWWYAGVCFCSIWSKVNAVQLLQSVHLGQHVGRYGISIPSMLNDRSGVRPILRHSRMKFTAITPDQFSTIVQFYASAKRDDLRATFPISRMCSHEQGWHHLASRSHTPGRGTIIGSVHHVIKRNLHSFRGNENRALRLTDSSSCCV